VQCVPPDCLTIIVNTGDDFEHFGLYYMSRFGYGLLYSGWDQQPVTGWGRSDETWQVMHNLSRLGAPDWFNLGDRDIATHLERTRRLQGGQKLSQVTHDFCQAWGVRQVILPMSDDPVQTWVDTDRGCFCFKNISFVFNVNRLYMGLDFRTQKKLIRRPALWKPYPWRICVICPSNPG
jgi:LPPG:FO 2-phospho-L-lactate transferase